MENSSAHQICTLVSEGFDSHQQSNWKFCSLGSILTHAADTIINAPDIIFSFFMEIKKRTIVMPLFKSLANKTQNTSIDEKP